MAEDQLQKICRQIRHDILVSTTAAGSGHPSSSLSAVELMAGLMFGGVFRADVKKPRYPANDKLIFSKGHATPLLYALYAAAGKVSAKELPTLRRRTSRLQGHPMMDFPYTEIPTGSLGQGLSAGLGMAIGAKLDRSPARVYVLLGDSEMAEGSVWEAIQLATARRVDNLAAVVDVNRLGQSGPTMLGRNVQACARRVISFGWKTIVIDGHDLAAVKNAYRTALKTKGRPTMIIAATIKGQGVSVMADKAGWHGKTLSAAQLRVGLAELGPMKGRIVGLVARPRSFTGRPKKAQKPALTQYTLKASISPRKAFGEALTASGKAWPGLVVLDGDVKNSTMTEGFSRAWPGRFIEGYIAEQNMVGMAGGLAAAGKLPVAATFAAFLTRAFDQLRMQQYAGTHQIFVGTHAGVHIGPDGASQMGLEDLAMFRSLPDATILYPADAIATQRLFSLLGSAPGMNYLRLTRAELAILYSPKEKFHIGGSHVWRRNSKDVATIVAAGVTLFEALKAADQLAGQGIAVSVIDCYSVQPIDVVTLRAAARRTKHLIVVEDHRPSGGLADAVRVALGPLAGTVVSLAVNGTSHSAAPEQQLRIHGLDAAAIMRAVKKISR